MVFGLVVDLGWIWLGWDLCWGMMGKVFFLGVWCRGV